MKSVPICRLLLVALSAQVGCIRDSADTTKSDSLIEGALHVADLRSRPVIGQLGHPLGTIVTVEGKFQDMTFTRTKADDGRIVMIVEKVNGDSLQAPKRFDFRPPRWARRSPKPANGEVFRIVGYETGGFLGDVEGEAEYEQEEVAKVYTPFDFYSSFHVLMTEAPEQLRETATKSSGTTAFRE